MMPTEKHNDEELREAMASLEWAMANDNSLTQHQKECLRTVLASLESARADSKRLDWFNDAVNVRVRRGEDDSWIICPQGFPAPPFGEGKTFREAIDDAAGKHP